MNSPTATDDDLRPLAEAIARQGDPRPLHAQISSYMRNSITSGVWPPHYRLRAEHELARELSVSRGTLKRALSTLVDEGLLVQIQGRGTFVTSANPVETGIATDLLSLAETLSNQGIAYVTDVLDRKMTIAEPKIAALLDLPAATQLLCVERIRRIEQQPIAYLVNYIHPRIGAGLSDEQLRRRSLFELIEEGAGERISTGRRTFEARAADPLVAGKLDVPEGSPVLYFEQVTYLERGEPIEYSDVWLRSDLLRVSSLLRRP